MVVMEMIPTPFTGTPPRSSRSVRPGMITSWSAPSSGLIRTIPELHLPTSTGVKVPTLSPSLSMLRFGSKGEMDLILSLWWEPSLGMTSWSMSLGSLVEASTSPTRVSRGSWLTLSKGMIASSSREPAKGLRLRSWVVLVPIPSTSGATMGDPSRWFPTALMEIRA